MPEFDGRQIHYGIAREGVAGTAEADAQYWINRLGGRIYRQNEKIENTSSYGSLNEVSNAQSEREWSEGNLNGKVTTDSFGLVLLSAMGAVQSSVNQSDYTEDVHDHEFTMLNSVIPPTLTVFRKDPVSGDTAFPGSVLDNLEITGELGNYIRWSADHLGFAGESADVTPAYSLETEFRASGANLRVATNEAGLAGAANIATVQSFTLNTNRNMQRDDQMGSKNPYAISTGQQRVTLTMTLRWTDMAFENLNFADQKRAFLLQLTDNTIIGDSASPQLDFVIPVGSVHPWNSEEELGSKAQQVVTVTALTNFAPGSALKATLTNTVESYAA